ncbi:hypothetical protein ACLOJK_003212 [Asimina triloba]
MDKNQELEWLEAQKIVISFDLIATAKQQLQFLAAVDRNRCLYDGPVLNRAIHRLNPVQYKADCQKFYGRILDDHNVVSTVQGTFKQKTEEIWTGSYPEEPYELDFSSPIPASGAEKMSESVENITYDLVSAVKRQRDFFYQVSRPCVHDDRFLEAAQARYKGFLHLIKRNGERSWKLFCVPTYDIDLMWHSHQLHPVSYCKDLVEVLGRVLGHDDTDSDRSKGKKLDNGFTGTTKHWEELFGQRYWKAGAMYRGSSPSPVAVNPWPANSVGKNIPPWNEYQKYLQLPQRKVVEVLLEIVDMKNLPAEHKGSLFVSFSKSQPDSFLTTSRRLRISSEYGQKQVSGFQCEPTGELVIKLMSRSQSPMWISKAPKTLGSTSISLQNLVDPTCELSVDKWFELAMNSYHLDAKPISLHIAASFTLPTIAPSVLHMVRSHPFSVNNCFFPLPGRVQQLKGWTCVVDDTGSEIMTIQMRYCLTLVFGRLKRFFESNCLGKQVKFFPGRKLDYERRCCHKGKNEQDFMTAVRFSAEEPYGKAIALFNLKSSLVKVDEEWFVMPGIVLTVILSDLLRKEGYAAFVATGDVNIKEMASLEKEVDNSNVQVKNMQDLGSKTEVMVLDKISAVAPGKGGLCGGCGGGCGGSCGNNLKSSSTNGADTKSSGCGGCGGCGGSCGNNLKSSSTNGADTKSSGCGGCGGCGGSCGNNLKSSRCGGCGSGCSDDIKSTPRNRNDTKSSGCGSGCSNDIKSSLKTGNDIKSSGCAGCGSGCGNDIKSSARNGNDIKSSGCAGCSGCGGGCGGAMTK